MSSKLPEISSEELENMYQPEEFVRLTDLERGFCQHYVDNGGNGVKAAKKVGEYSSDNSAKQRAFRILNGIDKPSDDKYLAKAYIQFLIQQRQEANAISKMDLVAKLNRAYDMSMVNERGDHAIKAVETMARVLGMLNKDTQQAGESSTKTTQQKEDKKDNKILQVFDDLDDDSNDYLN